MAERRGTPLDGCRENIDQSLMDLPTIQFAHQLDSSQKIEFYS